MPEEDIGGPNMSRSENPREGVPSGGTILRDRLKPSSTVEEIDSLGEKFGFKLQRTVINPLTGEPIKPMRGGAEPVTAQSSNEAKVSDEDLIKDLVDRERKLNERAAKGEDVDEEREELENDIKSFRQERAPRQPGLTEQMRGRGAEPTPTIGPDDEIFEIVTQEGYRNVVVPKSREGRIKYMRNIMYEVEKTSDPNGGLYRIQNQELYYIIDKLIRRREGSVARIQDENNPTQVKDVALSEEVAKKDKEDGEMLHAEWQARNAFHGVFLTFNAQADMKDIKALMDKMPGESLNALFRIKEVIYSIGFLHEHGEKYIKAFSSTLNASPPDRNDSEYEKKFKDYENDKKALSDFKDEAASVIKERMKDKLKTEQESEKLTEEQIEEKKKEIDEQDLKWAINLGERLFQFGGGLSVYDELKQSNYERVLKEVKENEKSPEDLKKVDTETDRDQKFITGGGLNGGLWAYRRLYKYKEFAQSYKNRRNFQSMIWDGIDLETGTLFDELSKKTGGGFLSKDSTLPAGRKFDFDKFVVMKNWKEFDFHSLGPSPLFNGWFYMGVDQPEGAAAAIRDTNEGAQILPSVKALEKLRTAFYYKEDGGWGDKKQLVKNYINWARKATDEYGKPQYEFHQLRSDIIELIGMTDKNKPAFIRPKDTPDIMAELYELQGPWKTFIERKDVHIALSFLPAFIIEIIIRILKYGFSNK